jgi:hypothetical protein
MHRSDFTRQTPFLRRHPLASALAAGIACVALFADRPATARPEDGATVPVLNCDDAGPGSLRDAVAQAHSGDSIVFASDIGCNLVSLTSGPIAIANDATGQPFLQLNIWGTGRDTLTIDGGGLDRVFVQNAGDGAILGLFDLTVAHGRSNTSGGCVRAAGAVSLQHVADSDCVAGVISGDTTLGNAAVRGGGIYAANAALLYASTVTDSHVYGGAAYAYGGGVFAVRTVAATTSSISGNTIDSVGGGAYGGGLAAGDRAGYMQAALTLTSSVVSGNSSRSGCGFCGSRGGGAWAYGNAYLTDGEVSENTASSSYHYGTGGGLYLNARFGAAGVAATAIGTHFHCNTADNGGGIAAGGDLVVSRATLDCNNTLYDGAGIELLGGNLTLSDSALVGNDALGRGGGLFIFGYGDAAITNSTISGNIATDGAGIANTYGTLHVSNSTIAQNGAFEHGGGVYFRYPYYAFDLTSSIIAGNDSNEVEDIFPPGMTITGSHDIVRGAPGVDLPPDTIDEDPRLQPLGDNGGGTPTLAFFANSPAIDAGMNPLGLSHDQRGEGFARVYGAAADIGAYEEQPTAPSDRIFADGFDP